MAPEQEGAHHFRMPEPRQHFPQRKEIVERLRHLHTVDIDEAVVHPDVHECGAGAAGLRDLVLVMRKFQIHAAAVDVEVVAEHCGRHRRAFDVPARTPRSPGRIPGRLAGLGALPEHEIERIALGGVDVDARAGAQVVETLSRQAPVAGEARDRVTDVTVRGHVGKFAPHQLFDKCDDAGQVRSRARLVIRALAAQRRAVFVHRGDEAHGQRFDRFAVLRRTLDDLVVDVGDVADIVDLVAAVAQVAAHHIEHHQEARVTDMAVVVDGHAADIHADPAWMDRLEDFTCAGE